tara:strand:- start:199 stop:462 length:264 start_codon:yes stop_codon:yes gene_type:complete
MKKSELQAIIREEIQNVLSEASPPKGKFKNWKVIFKDNGTYGGVKAPKQGSVETVKARNTAEAIRKAATKVGLKDWWGYINVDVKLA